MSKHLLSGCSTTVNFAKLSISSILTAAVTWSLRLPSTSCYGRNVHIMASDCNRTCTNAQCRETVSKM